MHPTLFSDRLERLSLSQRPSERAAQFGGTVPFVPASVCEDDALWMPGKHGAQCRPEFTLVTPGETQAQVARQTAMRGRDTADPRQQAQEQGADFLRPEVLDQVREDQCAARTMEE